MSHQEDGGANDAFKQALGLIAVTFTGATPTVGRRFQGVAAWTVEAISARVRGPLNNGGLYGEREGWYLPGYPDHDGAGRVPAGHRPTPRRRLVPDDVSASRYRWVSTSLSA